MTIKVPYSKTELLLAAITACSKIEENSEEIAAKLKKVSDEDISLNESVAKHNGISVLDLINSPNMPYLVEQWRAHCMEQALLVFKEYGLTEKEAWSCVLSEHLESL